MIFDKRIDYLQDLCNKYGDFKVASSWKDEKGEVYWTKHRSVMECWQSDEGLKFLSRVTHRQIQPYEIVLDFDTPESILLIPELIRRLEKITSQYKVYTTGSKGYHIHFNLPQLAKLKDEKERDVWKNEFCKFWGADLHKANSKMLIALENVPHWKSGKIKQEVNKNDFLV